MRLAPLFLLPAVVACSESDRPDYFTSRPGNGGSGTGGSVDPDLGSGLDDCEEPQEEIDTSRLCGNQVVPIIQKQPNLYFLVDVSGSMTDSVSAGGRTKLAAAKQSLTTVAKQLGHRINYGMAAFPGPRENDPSEELAGCAPGLELFETRAGDELVCGEARGGAVLEDFTDVVLDLDAVGGTPLSATLDGLSSTLLTLEGSTSVILMTDGGPNCNPEATCPSERCIFNIEQVTFPSGDCQPGGDYNCCDSSTLVQEDAQVVPAPEASCIDDDSAVDAIEELFDAGIETYVIGVPGSEPYADTMNRMAVAGGTALAGDIAYYDVTELDALTDALLQVGSEVAQSCNIQLESVPDDPDLVNVYLDTELLAADPEDGWTLDSDIITLEGAACDRVKSGEVMQVQIVFGCNTVVR